jgi:hypothetical protein
MAQVQLFIYQGVSLVATDDHLPPESIVQYGGLNWVVTAQDHLISNVDDTDPDVVSLLNNSLVTISIHPVE